MKLATARIQVLEKKQKILIQRLDTLEKRLVKLYKFVLSVKELSGKTGADLSADLLATHNRINKLEGKQEELNYQINQVAEELKRVEQILDKNFALGLSILPKDLNQDPKSLKTFILNSFNKKEYDKVIVAAKLYMRLYPDMPDAARIQYILGEAYMKQKMYGPAIKAFKVCSEVYKDSKPWSFKALFGIVNALLAQSNCKKAIAVLNYIYSIDRRGQFGKTARLKLKRLRKTCKK